MVLDSSALIAILRKESEAGRFIDIIESASPRLIAAPTLVETSIVMLGRFGERGLADLIAIAENMELSTVSFSHEHVAIAVDAFRRYGKGRHPAGLNLGDCYSYALAKATDQPLLFKGEDFEGTDVERAG